MIAVGAHLDDQKESPPNLYVVRVPPEGWKRELNHRGRHDDSQGFEIIYSGTIKDNLVALAAHRATVYIAGHKHLYVYDLTNATAPKKIAQLSNLYPGRILIGGTMLGVSTPSGVYTFDITDPKKPRAVAKHAGDVDGFAVFPDGTAERQLPLVAANEAYLPRFPADCCRDQAALNRLANWSVSVFHPALSAPPAHLRSSRK